MVDLGICIKRPATLNLANRGFYHGGYQSGENGRGGYRSKDTSHYSSLNHVARVYIRGRGGYSYHNSHYSSHIPGGHGRFLGFSFYSHPVEENVHGDKIVGYSGRGYNRGDVSGDDGGERRDISVDDGDERGDISVDDRRLGFRSQ